MAPFSPDKIIIHHSACGDSPVLQWAAIRAYHKSLGWLDIGYHGGVELAGADYEMLIGRPWTMVGAHTLGQNQHALGLCLAGNFNLSPPPHDQILIAARYAAMWCHIFSIDTDDIYPHKKFNDTDCPGALFDIDAFKRAVELAL